MTKKLFSLIFLTFYSVLSQAQWVYNQYFDGKDTAAGNSIVIHLDTAASNIWQIGRPQKTIFDSAATHPNVLVTDTVNMYPAGNTSVFSFFTRPVAPMTYGIIAIRWKQKLDMDTNHAGGIVEFSADTGKTWQNVFNNPYIYNFYGFDTTNKDTLLTGEYAFSGTDTVWRDIWLCFNKSFFNVSDSFQLRFTFKSDNVSSGKEGWMIDNMMIHNTGIHTVATEPDMEYMKVYPTKTSGIINIEAAKLQEYHIIEHIQLIDISGKVVQEHGKAPTKFYIDIGHQPEGLYYLKVKTNKKTETFPVFLNKT